MTQPVAPPSFVDPKDPKRTERDEIRDIALAYLAEAEDNRRSGTAGRDGVWEDNWNLLWNRFGSPDKASWQANETLPEGALFVERMSAAFRQALVRSDPWYTVKDTSRERTLEDLVARWVTFFLDRCGRNAHGQVIEFAPIFADIVKLGAVSMMAARVDYEEGVGVRVTPIDPRDLWYDVSGRGLYRIYRYRIDHHELMRRAKDNPTLYDVEAVESLASGGYTTKDQEMRTSTAHGQEENAAGRRMVEIHEFKATFVRSDGTVLGPDGKKQAFFLLANRGTPIWGPFANPYWHGRDNIVGAPMISVPGSPYGKSYMENWGPVAKTFVELTNLLLDAVAQTSVNAYMIRPWRLRDPTQATSVHAGKTFQLEEDTDDGTAPIEALELGRFPSQAVPVWQGVKEILREGAGFSELGVGQLPPKGDITAREIDEASGNSEELISGIVEDTENRFLVPTVSLVWWTSLQFAKRNDAMVDDMDEGMRDAFLARKEEFRERRFGFVVKGISGLLAIRRQVRNILAFLDIVGRNELLATEFARRVSIDRVWAMILKGLGLDSTLIEKTPQEQQAEALATPSPQPPVTASGAPSGPPGPNGSGAGA